MIQVVMEQGNGGMLLRILGYENLSVVIKKMTDYNVFEYEMRKKKEILIWEQCCKMIPGKDCL